jgi:hypothetical protein
MVRRPEKKLQKILHDTIKINQTTQHRLNEAMAGNFKLALRGKAIDRLNNIKDTEGIDTILWSNNEPHFKALYDKHKLWTIWGLF